MTLNLPYGYQPFPDLAVCSNRFINGIAPFAMGNQPILLVGQSDIPLVWLYVLSPETPDHFIALVEENEPRMKAVQVERSDEDVQMRVLLGENILFNVRKILDDFAAIDALDLRPIGLNIHGSEGGLFVGGMTMVGNRSEGSTVMVGLG